jgi:uroporphyrin-III C-methyltransferase
MLSVTLVGAGPGDAELLTLKAIRAIRRATVVLVDELVGEGVLRYARPSARIIYVGKRGGCKSTVQASIEERMLEEALRGERVVRVKGGDPFVFGRGGEEAQFLRAHGVAVEVVNGITSGLAAATALGVPLTHRDHAHGVILITGHAKEGSQCVDWPTLGAACAQGLTLVIYMGVAQAGFLQQGLLQTLPAHTPVAVVEYAAAAPRHRPPRSAHTPPRPRRPGQPCDFHRGRCGTGGHGLASVAGFDTEKISNIRALQRAIKDKKIPLEP